MDSLRIALAQLNTTVGDFEGNSRLVLEALEHAKDMAADIVLFPELTLCGYPAEDLLFKSNFIAANRRYLEKIIPHTNGLTAVVGFVDADGDIFNAAAVLHNGTLGGIYRKFLLPNYGVFDEERYFRRGNTESIFKLGGTPLGVSVCEDIWYPAGPPEHQAANGAQILLNISASPYQLGKIQHRERMLATRATDNVAVVAYCNLVGGQDELLFDGSSVIFDERGNLLARAKSFEPDFIAADVELPDILRQRLRDPRRRKNTSYHISYKKFDTIHLNGPAAKTEKPPLDAMIAPSKERYDEIYSALVQATRDYLHKNGFSQAVIGLSGGIDSALVAAIAADALGAENVVGVSMPSRYSSDHSKSDAQQLAENLGIRYETIPIEPIFNSYLDALAPQFADTAPNEAEENLQSRARGNILMALSNKFGWLVLTTGNKSEMSVGYATLYGDMAGGFAVIKDVPKTMVYDLCRYRNTLGAAIPQNIIDKPPSAELRPDQFDTDSLPPYYILDDILAAYVEDDLSIAEIVARGHAPETVRRVVNLVDRTEYKRRQAPPGVKITVRAFGKDRRLPITNKFTDK